MKLRLAANFGTAGASFAGATAEGLLYHKTLQEGAMTVLLGAIADDFTGATDLCNTLVRRGMRTVQLVDVPRAVTEVGEAEAVVIALKSRTIPVADAIEKSLAALGWLQNAGVPQILFKYCSTFDSTDTGN